MSDKGEEREGGCGGREGQRWGERKRKSEAIQTGGHVIGDS